MEQSNSNNTFYVNVSGTSDSISFTQMYNKPEVIRTIINSDKVEVIKKATSMISYTSTMSDGPDPLVWKEIYEPIDGQIKHTKTITGKYIPPRDEYYEFDE